MVEVGVGVGVEVEVVVEVVVVVVVVVEVGVEVVVEVVVVLTKQERVAIMPTIEVSDETYAKIKDQLTDDESVDVSSFDDLVGKKWFFRTVTYHMLGKVKRVIGGVVELECASWVADSGRFTQFVKDGTVNEVEPVGQWFVNLDTVTDFGPWKHALPTKQK